MSPAGFLINVKDCVYDLTNNCRTGAFSPAALIIADDGGGDSKAFRQDAGSDLKTYAPFFQRLPR